MISLIAANLTQAPCILPSRSQISAFLTRVLSSTMLPSLIATFCERLTNDEWVVMKLEKQGTESVSREVVLVSYEFITTKGRE